MSHDGPCYCPNCDRSLDRKAMEFEIANGRRERDISLMEAATLSVNLVEAEEQRDAANARAANMEAARNRAQTDLIELEDQLRLLRGASGTAAVPPRFDGEDYLRAMPGGHTMAAGPAPEPVKPLATSDREAEQAAWADFAHKTCGHCGLSVRSCDDIEGGPKPLGCPGPVLRFAARVPCSLCGGDPVGRLLCSKCMGTGRTPSAGTAPRPARCRGKCAKVTPHHICWGGDGVYFICTKCGEQFKSDPDERGTRP